MHRKRIRALTWTLVALGLAILALGTTLALTLPASGQFSGPWFGQGAEGFGHRGAFALGRGFGGMGMGMHLAGGFLLFIVVVAVVLALIRRSGFAGRRFAAPTREDDAVTLLRVEYAEGRIAEAEYQERLAVLRG